MAKNNDVTTKFKVDISDLKKNISEANRQIKLANATFKAETGGMSDWSKSVDGINAKLKQLDSVLDAQKEKLAAYREQYDRQQEAFDENAKKAEELRNKLRELTEQGIDESSEEFRGFAEALQEAEREQENSRVSLDNLRISMLNQEGVVKGVESEIESYNGTLAELEGSTDEAAEGSDRLEESIEETAKSAEDADSGFSVLKGVLSDLVSGAISAAVDALKDMAQAAYDAWKAYDSGADTIRKATGATGDAAEELTKSYENVARTVKGSFDDIGTAIGEVNTRFGSTGEELEGLAEQFLKFAELNGTNVKTSIDSVQSTMAMFGVETEQTAAFLDTLNKAGQDTGVSVDSLLSSLKANSAALDEMGYSLSDSVMLLANLEKNGVDTSTAMAGLKKALQTAVREGTPMSEAMSGMTESIKGAKDETEAMSIASELFGAKAGPAMAKAIRDGRLEFDRMGTTFEDFEGSVDSTYDSILSANDMLDLAVQSLKVDAASMFDELLNTHKDEIQAAADTLQNTMLPAVKGLLSGVEGAEKEIGEAAGALVGEIVEKIAAALPQAVKIGSAVITSLKEGVIKALPSVIRSIGTAGKDILKALKTLIPEIIGSLLDAVPQIADALLEAIPELLEGAIEFFDAIVQAVPLILPKLTGAIPQVIRAVSDALIEGIPQIIEGAVTLLGSMVDAIPQLIDMYGEYIPDLVEAIAELLVENVPVLLKGAVKLFMALVDAIPKVITSLSSKLLDIVETVTSKLDKPLGEVFGDIWDNFINVWSGIGSWLKDNVIKPVINSFKGLWDDLSAGAKGAWERIKSIFGTLADFFGKIFSEAWDTVRKVFSTGGEIFKGIKEGIFEAFRKIVNSLIKGINTVVSVPFEAINKVLNKIRDTDIMGFKPFETLWESDPLKIPSIPMLARGGVLRRGQMGLLEGTGAEAVIPLENNKAWIKAVADELKMQMNAVSAGMSGDVVRQLERLAQIEEAIAGSSAASLGRLNSIYSISEQSRNALDGISANTAGMDSMGVYINGNALVGQISRQMDKSLGQISQRRARGN